MRRPKSFPILVLGLAGAVGALAEASGDWPQWGGPLRNATAPESSIPSGAVELRELWRRPAGEGIAALAVVGDRVFSLAAENGEEHAFAWNAATGQPLWRLALGPGQPGTDFRAPSTPAADGTHVFLLTSTCRLLAVLASDGKEVWRHDLKAEYNPGAMPNGCWTSPLLAEGRLIVQVNGEPDKRVIAFDKTSGTVVWTSPGVARAQRSSPLLAAVDGVRQVVVHDIEKGKGGLYGLRLDDGALLWSTRFPDAEAFSHDSPIPLSDNRFAVPTWNDVRVVQVRKQGDGFAAEPVWTGRVIRTDVPPATSHLVFHQGHLYGFGGEYLSCLEAATGKLIWQEKTYPGSLVLAGGHLIVLSQITGLLRVVQATPAGYREVARKEVFNPGAAADTPPSVAGNRIYLRNSEEVVALEIVSARGGEGKKDPS